MPAIGARRNLLDRVIMVPREESPKTISALGREKLDIVQYL
jgi:hypothetical protein